jgi:hypothetical protein
MFFKLANELEARDGRTCARVEPEVVGARRDGILDLDLKLLPVGSSTCPDLTLEPQIIRVVQVCPTQEELSRPRVVPARCGGARRPHEERK